MTVTKTQAKLQADIATLMRKIEALESAYETITIGQLVSMRARTHGSTIAIEVFDRSERATYSEMDQLSNKYANALRSFGVCKGDRVGVMLPNRIEFPILWFAIAKLGAVMVPINMRYTPREIEFVLSDTQAKFALVDESAWPVFSAMNPWPQDLALERTILVGQHSDAAATVLGELLDSVEECVVEEDVSPDDLLNIQYTSGTTGFPKGCMLTHDYWGVSSYQGMCWEQPYQRYLSAQPFFYVDPPGHLVKSYRQGGTLYLAPQLSSTRFLGWVKQYRIEWCQFPELVARQAEAADEDGTTCLKQTLNWGWSPDSVRQFRKRFRVNTQDAYGMTEIGFGTRMTNELDELADSGSVGIRSLFRELRLMNEDGSPTLVGNVGELWVRGRGIFKGYWNKPEANAASFEGEWFKTGDRMRRDELGFYWLVGRTKDMIRRSSENIAAREVEVIIRESPEIVDVAAVPVPDVKRGEEVKIYVQLNEGVAPDNLTAERILEHARAHLAAFKVPRYIAFTPTLPRAPTSNKVLKRELMEASDPLAGAYDTEQKRWR
ncbi:MULTISPECIES: class I adenylate-forming enzyme family protein [Bradyrhizobium]|uniref:class I adenylate-forming enzyme family protein n=1 Tax=Bradyrhizobium centrosematis TaxID=1300039 RepID=UPI002166D6D5|nr:class I adenylate-forming enzyme family protein [Bradyrhizobium centrosematis]MCS3765662.1 long-chain acyl-CoA synthetase/crotonobetaine/carnitine-CoA ligase [Bradyrhizobium centrosematis]MCS3777888.1 long-chain acyl-CoA synthetase/crotonobetaine/carnitine-CoA ligase [Bradyrhizobium centrosematis]